MTQCWREGALRAYLDGELSEEDEQRVVAHVKVCADCQRLCTELAARATMVGALMELLPEGAGGALPRLAPGPRRQWKWTGMAVALAAGLALAVYLMPARHAREEAIVLPALARAAEIEAGAAAIPATPAVAETPVAHRPRRARVARQTVEEPEHFVALDDEPFEAGVIMRVDVKPGNVQADIVFGPDGRAHAFRLVNATQRDY